MILACGMHHTRQAGNDLPLPSGKEGPYGAAVLPARTPEEVRTLFERATRQQLVGKARKTRPVDARPARTGEVIVTEIRGEGKETVSPPASEGDWVVRNRCPETGNEQYLVSAKKFEGRYRRTERTPMGDGWAEFIPQGKIVRFFFVPEAEGAFTFKAPWGEDMVARPGDALVQDLEDPTDLYRVAAASFRCTYEVVADGSR
jgi:hypothetical protein